MIYTIRLEKLTDKCPKCSKKLEPKEWQYDITGKLRKRFCPKCEILYEYKED